MGLIGARVSGIQAQTPSFPAIPALYLWATAATQRSLPTLALIHPVSNYNLAKSHTRCTPRRHRPESPSNFRSEYR